LIIGSKKAKRCFFIEIFNLGEKKPPSFGSEASAKIKITYAINAKSPAFKSVKAVTPTRVAISVTVVAAVVVAALATDAAAMCMKPSALLR
jgi:hypothetical protein